MWKVKKSQDSADNNGRSSNVELLRILCILFIIGDHFTGQSGIFEGGALGNHIFYCTVTSLSRVACSVFIIISAWFSVDRAFKFRKIIHVWLTVLMYTVPITVYLIVKGAAGRANLITAFLPVENSPLWFAGYYIVLVMLSPMLNRFITQAPKAMIEYFLLSMFLLQSLFTTMTTSLGFFSNDIWTLIFIYVLTGYIKIYYTNALSSKKSFFIFGSVWVALTCLRAVAAYYGWGIVANYCETYRARLQTVPNLIMAYTLFFGFLGAKIHHSKVINKIASTTLGVYCFHQVPVWYDYLWMNGFHADVYSQILHGWRRMVYTIFSIVIVWIVGTVIELIRSNIAGGIVENRKYCKKFCSKIDGYVNNFEKIDYEDEKKLFLKKIIGMFVIYYIFIDMLNFIAVYFAQ